MQLNLTGEGPIYNQIVEQVRQAVAVGKLAQGTRLPTVRALAARLGVNVNTVGRAYAELERAGVVVARPGRGSFVAANDRLGEERKARLLALVGHSVLEALSLGYSTGEVEAAFGLGLARWGRGAASPPAPAPPAHSLILVGSHDLLLELVAARLARGTPPLRLQTMAVGSVGGLLALARREAQVAGCHLLDAETGEYNLPFVRRLLPGRRVVLVQLAGRQQGLIVQRGNPRNLVGLADLLRPDLVFVNRQAGSGTRLLLDYRLAQAGLPREAIGGYEHEETTHVRVAAAVFEGKADVGLGILAAAQAFGLAFVPLWQERYDLVIPGELYQAPLLAPLLETLADPDFRQVVEELGGYDVAGMGQVLAET